jgi:hypothetical protein
MEMELLIYPRLILICSELDGINTYSWPWLGQEKNDTFITIIEWFLFLNIAYGFPWIYTSAYAWWNLENVKHMAINVRV